jgi:flagellin-like hook-associated protein FlgL
MIGVKWNGTEFAAASRNGDILTSSDWMDWPIQSTENPNLVEDVLYGDNYWAGITLGEYILRSSGTTEPRFLNLQVGPNSNDIFEVPLTNVRTAALRVDEVDFSTLSGAQNAISKIDRALGQVSSQQATYGGDQNLLKYTLDNVLN